MTGHEDFRQKCTNMLFFLKRFFLEGVGWGLIFFFFCGESCQWFSSAQCLSCEEKQLNCKTLVQRFYSIYTSKHTKWNVVHLSKGEWRKLISRTQHVDMRAHTPDTVVYQEFLGICNLTSGLSTAWRLYTLTLLSRPKIPPALQTGTKWLNL